MKLIYKIITLFVIICSINNIYGQRFTNPVGFEYGRDVDTDIVYNVSGTVRYIGFRSEDYFTFPIEDAQTIAQTGHFSQNTLYYTYSSISDVLYGSAMTDNYIYLAGIGNFFRFKFASGDETEVIPNGEYTIIKNGGVSYEDKIFILAIKTDSGEPVLFKYDEATKQDFNDISNFDIIPIEYITSPTTITVEEDSGILFIGGEDSLTVVFDINTNSFTPSQPEGDNKPKVDVYTMDTQRKILYSCVSDSFIASVNVINYTDPKKLEYIDQYQLFADSCMSGYVDMIGGQIFFVVTTDEGTSIVGSDPEGENQESLVEPINSGESLRIIADPKTFEILLFMADSVYTTSYTTTCPLSCSGHGFCNYGVCECEDNYFGEGCETKLCLHLNNCSGQGECKNGQCFCQDIFDGPNCTVRICPSNCNDRGFCNVPNNYTCECNTGYQGNACEEKTPPPVCELLDDSKTCIERDDCGWCETDKVCAKGDKFGPYVGFCRTWFFDQDVEIGVIALAIIFICCIGILYLIDIGTSVPVDLRRAKDYQEEYKSGQHPKATHEEASVLWWRDQRSHKAWTLMDQFQFIALVSHIGVLFPSRFISFTEYLDWSNLGIPLPPSINPPQVWTADRYIPRDILSMAQYENSLGSGDLYLLPNILFWFGLLCGVFLVPLLFVLLIISFIERLVHWKEVITNRIIHISVRILSFSYLGVLLAASFAMVTPLHDYRIIIPGAIIFVLYGIGLPIAIWFILNVPEARLHNPTFKQQFGCLYVHFKPKTDHRFIVFMFIKRFIMAVIVGILAFKPLASQPLTGTDLAVPIVQVVVIDIALIGYAVLLFIRKPYFDHYQLWLEYLLTGINVVTCSLSLTHIKTPSPAGELIACLIQAIALIACIASYVISWLQMRSKFLKKLQKVFSCCKCGKSDQTIEMGSKK